MNDTNTQTQYAIHKCVVVSELQHTDNVQQEMKNLDAMNVILNNAVEKLKYVEKKNGKLKKEGEKLKAGDVQCRLMSVMWNSNAFVILFRNETIES